MPSLTIVMVVHNMPREAPRTIFSLSPAYQRDVDAADYNVIIVENRSMHLLDPDQVNVLGDNFEYHLIEQNVPSPVAAVNFGIKRARTDFVAVIIDGARMASPGLVATTLSAIKAFDNPFIGSTAFHLGPKVQNYSQLDGYNQAVEDRLLEEVDWRQDGYRLFDVSVLAQSSANGFLHGIPSECSYWAMKRREYLCLGGLDESFISPGGGLVNHDFINRVIVSKRYEPVMLLGEGTFHQFHGGVATGSLPGRHPMPAFLREYRDLRGADYRQFDQPAVSYLGTMAPGVKKFLGTES